MTTIDLAASSFWIAAVVGVVLLNVITQPTLRRWVWAAVNLGLLVTVLSYDLRFDKNTLQASQILITRALCLLAGLTIIWLLLKALVHNRRRAGIWTFVGIITTGLFCLNKTDGLSARFELEAVNPLLAAMSFSYVALRLVDLFRLVGEQRQPAPDFPSTINYLTPFHMLAAGPIQSYDDFVAQPAVPPPLEPRYALYGLQRIANGLFKKYVLAYCISEVFFTNFRIYGTTPATAGYWFLEVQLFYIWLLLDFTAYSDIAVGIGILMGVATPENFNKPYLARNMIDFWERWHITLSQFIRRNVFIPIQMTAMRKTGGRYPRWVASVSFTIAFLLCGIWHDVSWPYLIWGALHAAGLVVANLYRLWLNRRLGAKGVKQYLQNPAIRLAACILTFEWVALTMFIVGKQW